MGTLRAALAPVIARHPDLLLEDKGQSLALHYRRQPRLAPYLHRLMHDLASGLSGLVELQRGKRVIEARPAGWHKGTAIAGFLAEPPFRGRRPVFIGDDVTDENGFVIVNALQGISVKVGPGPTAAHYRLADVTAVLTWLSAVSQEDA
jgi:trehalose 6-phosphate phosphatase